MCYVNRSIPTSMTNRRQWQVPSTESSMESRSTMTKNHGSQGRVAPTGGNKRDIVFQRASNVQRPIVSVPFFHFSFIRRKKANLNFLPSFPSPSIYLRNYLRMQKYRTAREKLEILRGEGRTTGWRSWFDDARIRIVEPTTGQRNTI